jgi:hypothetical protein
MIMIIEYKTIRDVFILRRETRVCVCVREREREREREIETETAADRQRQKKKRKKKRHSLSIHLMKTTEKSDVFNGNVERKKKRKTLE